MNTTNETKVCSHNAYKLYAMAFFLIGIIFWSIRIYYWYLTTEYPFSDMANFNAVALGIANSWNFQWNNFWQSYTTPTLPLFRALQIILFGESMLAWRIFQNFLLFSGVVWACYEIYKSTNKVWLALALFFVVAISKPSIFWGYKLAREGLQEALSFFVIANFIYVMRTFSLRSAFILGVVLALYFLNRANAILLVPIVIATIILLILTNKKTEHLASRDARLIVKIITPILIGIMLVWSPWVVRSYNLYGHIVPLSTQGPYGFLWELGSVTVKMPTGELLTTDVNTLQNEAPKTFINDYQAHLHASSIVRQWFNDNWTDYPALIIKKITNSLLDRTIYLTKVSREEMFPNYINDILLDKSLMGVILGVMGLFAMIAKYSRNLWILPIIALLPWLSATLVVGYPRMFEPSISIILFGNIYWFTLIFSILCNRVSKLNGNNYRYFE